MRHGRVTIAVFGTVLVASCAPFAGQNHQYLGSKTLGPYVGQVVDAETRAPIEGAVVVASWWRDRVWPGGTTSERYAAREVLTNREGRFVLDATQLEERAPGGTLRPTFTVFFPGYAGYPSASPRVRWIFREQNGFTEGEFSPRGIVVGLPRLATPWVRKDHAGSLDPFSASEDPFREVPEFMRLINREAVSVGLQPYRRVE